MDDLKGGVDESNDNKDGAEGGMDESERSVVAGASRSWASPRMRSAMSVLGG